MPQARLHITGASGAGTTTLGRALAQRLAMPHFDTDDVFWLPTDPPYRRKRDVAERLHLLNALLGERRDWVLSGSLDSWGGPVVPLFDLVVWLDVPTDIRLTRLAARQLVRYGRAAIAPGGVMHAQHNDFLDWAADYDHGLRAGRNRHRHEAWLMELTCPVLRLDGNRPTRSLMREVLAALAGALPRTPPGGFAPWTPTRG
jgi:adenylate kinase family enzyme